MCPFLLAFLAMVCSKLLPELIIFAKITKALEDHTETALAFEQILPSFRNETIFINKNKVRNKLLTFFLIRGKMILVIKQKANKIMNQKETLGKVLELIDSNFAKIGKATLMSGVEVKKLMALQNEGKPLTELDQAKLEITLIDFKK